MNDSNTALIIFAHGSKVPEANHTIARLAGEVSRRAGMPATAAFLDVAQPDLSAAVSQVVESGARRILIVPCFLVYGVHVREDLPRLVSGLQAAHPNVELLITQPLDGHPGLADLLAGRVREALPVEMSGVGPAKTG